MLRYVTAVEARTGFRLMVSFSDGSVKVVDLEGRLTGEVFEPLKDRDYFVRAFVHADLETVCWPNGADLAPEYLWEIGELVVPGRSAPASSPR